MTGVIQAPITAQLDLRDMVRRHVMQRSLACMERAGARREAALCSAAAFAAYRDTVRRAVRGFYGTLPAGRQAPRPQVTQVNTQSCDGFRIENVLFDSFPGWQVNATVYVPTEFSPPFPAVVVPVGHSGKQFESYQFPCQYFARSGFLAVCFDPPGQASEKQPGNDHFNDGVRDYLLGATSSRYFVADALRCLDYLQTRRDVDLSRGVAMTGVSGGGTTTSFSALLDERISVVGPSCCLAPLADLDITQCYAGCPETHMWQRYAEGIDEVDLLCAAAPVPCLLMAGAQDEVFRLADTRRLADMVEEGYAVVGAGERFSFFEDPGGHAYSLVQAREFVRFLARWLCDDLRRVLPELPNERLALLPHESLRCCPRTDVNMRSLAVAEGDRMAASWCRDPAVIRRAAAALIGVKDGMPVPAAAVGEPFQIWCHDWRSVQLRPEAGIELPATLLTAHTGLPAPTLLHVDDGGRHRLLYRQGLLAGAIGFGERGRPNLNLLIADLRGWGDSAPAMYPYEIAGWGGIDRYLAYATAALGDPIMAMRCRDGLSALAWLRTRAEVDPARVVVTGCGLGGMVALHVAAIVGDLLGVVVWDCLSSCRSLLAAERYPWPADAFLPGLLQHYDLPELAAAVRCPMRLHGLRDGAGGAAAAAELQRYASVPNGVAAASDSAACIVESIQTLAGVGTPCRGAACEEGGQAGSRDPLCRSSGRGCGTAYVTRVTRRR
jgi:cephalosporin-C deacetylase-like acetyl esterase